jgi:hypothetical protein
MPTDNSDPGAKLLLRREALASIKGETGVLDCFAGEGHMFENVWHQADHYLGLERRFRRPAGHARGECWRGDNRQMLERAMARADWNVVDLDAYGSPWQLFYRTLRLAKASRLAITTTCGLSRNLCSGNLVPWVSTITGTRKLSYSGILIRWYDDIIRWTLDFCVQGSGYRIVRVRRAHSAKSAITWYWLVELERTVRPQIS